MLSSMLREHQRAQDELRVEISNKRAIAEKAVENVTALNVKLLNDDISRAYMNQHRLDTEARKLQLNVQKLTKQAQQWMIVCSDLNGAVKDLGDINTWTRTIESDVRFIANAVEEAYRQPKSED